MHKGTRGDKRMKPYAIFVFEKLPEMATRYILREHSGAEIEAFPATWTQSWHSHVGEKYIVFRETQDHLRMQRYSHSLSLEKDRIVTGFNFTSEFPRLSWGDYQDDAILIEFNEDMTVLTLLFFRGMKKHSYSLFQRGIAGEIVETLESDILPLPMAA